MSETKPAIDKAIQKLSDQVTCPICLENYKDPKVLPCLHVFCKTCLDKLVSREGSSLTCPNCRKTVDANHDTVSRLEPAFYIYHLVDVLDTLQKVRDTKLKCQHCGQDRAIGYCRNCREFYCEPCMEVHKRWKGFMSHTIATTDEVLSEALNHISTKKATMVCSKHPEKNVEIYCETCQELICQNCVVRAHRDHDYDLVVDCFPKHQDAILASMQPVQLQLDIVNQAIGEMGARSRRLIRQTKAAKRQIDDKIKQLHSALDSRRDELMVEIDRVAKQIAMSLYEQQELYQVSQVKLSSCLEYVEESLRTGSQEEVLSIKKRVIETAEQMAREFNPADFQPEPEQAIRCSHQHNGLAEACLEFGDIFVATIRPGEPNHDNPDPATSPRSPQAISPTVQDIDTRMIETVTQPEGLATTSGGEILVVDRSANCIRILDHSGSKIRSVGKKELHNPHGVVICGDGTILVVAEHCVKRFTLRGKLIATVGSQGNRQLQFETPIAITCSPLDLRIYVCDTFNNRIQVLNDDLSFYTTFGNKGTGPGQFNGPSGVAVDTIGNVYVADYHNNRVQVLSPTGEFLRELREQIPGIEELKGPVSVCLDSKEFLYVLESNAYRVSVFNREGEFVKTFRNRDKAGEFNSLHGIAVDEGGLVYISDTDNHRIQVFQ